MEFTDANISGIFQIGRQAAGDGTDLLKRILQIVSQRTSQNDITIKTHLQIVYHDCQIFQILLKDSLKAFITALQFIEEETDITSGEIREDLLRTICIHTASLSAITFPSAWIKCHVAEFSTPPLVSRINMSFQYDCSANRIAQREICHCLVRIQLPQFCPAGSVCIIDQMKRIVDISFQPVREIHRKPDNCIGRDPLTVLLDWCGNGYPYTEESLFRYSIPFQQIAYGVVECLIIFRGISIFYAKAHLVDYVQVQVRQKKDCTQAGNVHSDSISRSWNDAQHIGLAASGGLEFPGTADQSHISQKRKILRYGRQTDVQLFRMKQGEILINGKPVHISSPSQGISQGIGLIPEDRKKEGLVLNLSIRHNISFARLNAIKRGGIISMEKDRQASENYISQLSIKTPSCEQLARQLSGGNQQKVVLAKWLFRDSEILIFDEPTRGIDIGAKQEIYRLMVDLVRQGKVLIMISSDMPELIGMSDRILVMHSGKVMGELKKDEFSQERILTLASGIEKEDSKENVG